MSMRTSGCATCAALLFLLAAGPAGAERQAQEAKPVPESSTSVTAAAEAVETSAETGLIDPDVDIAAGPVAELVSRDTLGRTISTYYCRTVGAARVHRTFLGFVAFKCWQRKRWCWSDPRILALFALCVVLLAAFAVIERRAGASALIPRDVMANPRFRAASQ